MLKKNAQLFEALFTASDLLVVSLAWLLSYWLRFISQWLAVEKGVPLFSEYARMLLFVMIIWAFVFRRFGLYRPMRGVNQLRELWLLIRANTFSVILLLAVTYLFQEKSVPFSRLVFVIFWFVSTLFVIGSRSVIRAILRSMRRRGFNLRYALIVGSGSIAFNIAHRLRAHPEYGMELIGCLTRDPKFSGRNIATRKILTAKEEGSVYGMEPAIQHEFTAPKMTAYPFRRVANSPIVNGGYDDAERIPAVEPSGTPLESPSGLKIIGTYSDLGQIIEGGSVDQVFVALPLADHDKLAQVIASIGDSMVDVRIIPDFHEFIQLGSLVEEIDGLPVVSLTSTPLVGINVVAKRVLDLLLATIFLMLASPIMLLAALLIKWTSRGPVLFVQERVGLDGRSFHIYKFRTMYTDAESNGACFAVKGDTRVTPLGRVLRRFSLDELPQLFNVILGHMSLVGPRPERPVFIAEFRRRIPRYMLRHKVQAGITGWAQVHGWRGNTSIERRIEHDLYYIENWSLGLDLKILGMTFVHSFWGRNAY